MPEYTDSKVRSFPMEVPMDISLSKDSYLIILALLAAVGGMLWLGRILSGLGKPDKTDTPPSTLPDRK